MSSLAEYRSWLVVEAADGFGMAAVTTKLLGDLGCTVAKLDRDRGARAAGVAETAGTARSEDPEACVLELVSRGKHSVGIDCASRDAAPALDALLRQADVLVADRNG